MMNEEVKRVKRIKDRQEIDEQRLLTFGDVILLSPKTEVFLLP